MEKLKLDIGCGGRGTMYPDFIGIDKHLPPIAPRKPGTTYIQMDFVYDAVMPWQPGTVDEIICFHTIEHMPYDEGQRLLSRAYSLLKPGAKMYFSCPNFRFNAEMYLKALDGDAEALAYWNRMYAARKDKGPRPMFHGDTIADKFMFQIRENTHYWQYDQESLIKAAEKAGCKNIEPMPYGHKWNKRNEYPKEEVGIIVTK